VLEGACNPDEGSFDVWDLKYGERKPKEGQVTYHANAACRPPPHDHLLTSTERDAPYTPTSRRWDAHAVSPGPHRQAARRGVLRCLSCAGVWLCARRVAVSGAPNAELRVRTLSAAGEAGRCASTAGGVVRVEDEERGVAGCDTLRVGGVAEMKY
jgi:hypothetical protein